MQVRIVRVLVAHRRVMMRMVVRLAARIVGGMLMLVVRVVNVAVRVVERFVAVGVGVPLRKVEIEA